MNRSRTRPAPRIARETDAPVPMHVLRHQCPHCRRSWAHRAAAARHMARCFKNPSAHGCKTCALWESAEAADWISDYPGAPEGCGAGEDLAAGLRVGCPKWEAIF